LAAVQWGYDEPDIQKDRELLNLRPLLANQASDRFLATLSSCSQTTATAHLPYLILQKSGAAIGKRATLLVNFRVKMFAHRTCFGRDANDELRGCARGRKSRRRKPAWAGRFSALSGVTELIDGDFKLGLH
jgi:hypothetical protein